MDDADLTILVCTLLGQMPGWAWRPDGPEYGPAEVGLIYGALTAEPDRLVGVRVTGGSDDPIVFNSQRQLQLRFRGRPGRRDDADRMAGAALDQLDGLTRFAGISFAERISFGPFGADTNAREERTDNYQIDLDNPEATPS